MCTAALQVMVWGGLRGAVGLALALSMRHLAVDPHHCDKIVNRHNKESNDIEATVSILSRVSSPTDTG